MFSTHLGFNVVEDVPRAFFATRPSATLDSVRKSGALKNGRTETGNRRRQFPAVQLPAGRGGLLPLFHLATEAAKGICQSHLVFLSTALQRPACPCTVLLPPTGCPQRLRPRRPRLLNNSLSPPRGLHRPDPRPLHRLLRQPRQSIQQRPRRHHRDLTRRPRPRLRLQRRQ